MNDESSTEEAVELPEGKGFPVGTVRYWGPNKTPYVRTRTGWIRQPKAVTTGGELPDPIAQPRAALTTLAHQGHLPRSPRQIEKQLRDLLSRHTQGVEAFKTKLLGLAMPGAKVSWRIKSLDQAIGKIAREPGALHDPSKMWDLTGVRVVVPTLHGVTETVGRIRSEFRVSYEGDHITRPMNNGYRAYHVTVTDTDGLDKEVQIRTQRQDVFAAWTRQFYKPPPEIRKILDTHRAEVNSYVARLSDHFYAVDSGHYPSDRIPSPPECPDVLVRTIGCPT